MQYYKSHKAHGLCVRCCKPSVIGSVCQKCRDKEKRRRDARRKAGICITHLHRKAVPGRTRCRKCLDRFAELIAKTRKKKPEVFRKRTRDSNKRMADTVISHYGAKCSCCGDKTKQFLTLHHVNKDGKEHRKQLGMKGGGHSLYRYLIKNGFSGKFKLVVLCWNCHMAEDKRGGCPHRLAREAHATPISS